MKKRKMFAYILFTMIIFTVLLCASSCSNIPTQERSELPDNAEPQKEESIVADKEDLYVFTDFVSDTLPAITFKLLAIGEAQEADVLATIYEISVAYADNLDEEFQKFEISSSYSFGEDMLSLVDIDCDGYSDIEVVYFRDRKFIYNYFRWNSEIGMFEEEYFFSLFTTDYTIFEDTKQILSDISQGVGAWTRELYQLTDGRYELIRTEHGELSVNGDESFSYIIHILEGDCEIYAETVTEDEYFRDEQIRENYLRFGTENPPQDTIEN